jgi:hypothetical protein
MCSYPGLGDRIPPKTPHSFAWWGRGNGAAFLLECNTKFGHSHLPLYYMKYSVASGQHLVPCPTEHHRLPPELVESGSHQRQSRRVSSGHHRWRRPP